MSQPAVSIHPYFKIHPGKLAAAQALLPAFVARTASEPACLSYEFTISDEVVFCRESYRNAEGALTHLGNVDALLKELLAMADLARLEIHGPAEEIEKLKEPLAAFNPTWVVFACGAER